MPDAPATQNRTLEASQVLDFCVGRWQTELTGLVEEFIRVPALSPAYDPDWEDRGMLAQVSNEAASWIRSLPLPGIQVEILRAPGRTPLVYVEVPGAGAGVGRTALFYGHLDKQPAGQGWSSDRSAWEPVQANGRLYGRGGADDGYSVQAALCAVLALWDQSVDRPRCVAVFETAEESGSPDLDHWLGVLADRIGTVDLMLCLDSGAGDYERLWLVTSLRGHCGGTLDVRVLDSAAHSGDAGGVVTPPFRVVRRLLDRLEDSTTGEVRVSALHAAIPEVRQQEASDAAAVLGDRIKERFAWYADGDGPVSPVNPDVQQTLLNRSWRPVLTVTGAVGLPPVADAGNVLLPSLKVKLSLRLPPIVDAANALSEITTVLIADPLPHARVSFTADPVLADGWNAPEEPTWLRAALSDASRACFNGNDVARIGQGGTIPLMAKLNGYFPDAQFLACGVQGPGTNAHGPDEALHLDYTARLTACLALTLHALTTA